MQTGTMTQPQAEKAPLSPLSFTTQLATMADDLFGGAFGGPSTPPRHAFIPMDTHACDHPGGGIVFALYVPGATLPDVGISVNDHDHQLFVSVARSGSAPPNPGYSTRSEVFTGPQSRIVSVPKRFDVSRARVVGLTNGILSISAPLKEGHGVVRRQLPLPGAGGA